MGAADNAIAGAFAPISIPPTAFSGTISTTAAVLSPDLAGVGGRRRWSITNTHASNILAVVFVAAGTAAGAQAITDGRQIPAGQSWEFITTSAIRVLVVANAASTTYGGIVSDV